MKNIRKSIGWVLLLLCVHMTAFSQSIILNNSGDTLSCFPLPQSRFLLKNVFKVEELNKLLNVSQALNENYRKDLIKADSVIYRKDEIIVIRNRVIDLKNQEITGLGFALASARQEIRRQKVYKWIAIISGAVVTGGAVKLYLSK